MTLFLIFAVVLLGLAAVAVYFFIFGRPNPPLAAGEVRIGSADFKVELATSTIAQARGLSFRASLPPDQGMLFIFSRPAVQNFWMKDMNFPLDMIWIGGGKVVGFVQDAPAAPGVPLWKLSIYSSPDGTDQVLEVDAGTVAKYGITVGEPVEIAEAN